MSSNMEEDTDISTNSRRLEFCKAVIFGDLETVKFYLQEGLDPNFVVGGKYREVSTLMKAVQGEEGTYDLSECLNEFGQHNNSCSPLNLAVVHNQYEVVLELLNNGADIDIEEKDWKQTALFNCFLPNVDERILDLLLERDCNIDHRDVLGRTALVYGGLAITDMIGYSKIRKLIQSGCNVCICDDYGTNFLHNWSDVHQQIHQETSTRGKLCEELLELFVNHGGKALVNVSDKQSSTPLHFAVDAACATAVKFLLKHGANPRAKDMDSFLPLLRLSIGQDEDDFRKIVDMLMQHVDINIRTVNRENILFGCNHPHAKINNIRYLITKGADVTCVDMEGITPLRAVVNSGKDTQEVLDIVDAFLSAGADINTQGNDGRTPLHCAVLKGKSKLAEHLIERGADLTKMTTRNESLIHFAAQHHDMLVTFTNPYTVNLQDSSGSTALHWAVSSLNVKSIQYLVQAGADLTISDSEERTPLELAQLFHITHSVFKLVDDDTAGSASKKDEPIAQNEAPACSRCTSQHWLQVCEALGDANDPDWEKHITEHEADVLQFSKMVIESNAMGLFYQTSENTRVSEVIVGAIEEIMKKVVGYEPLFASDIITAGSISEGTKCCLPDELDIILHLKEFTKAFEPMILEHVPAGYTMLQLKDSQQRNAFSRFMVREFLEGKLITDYLYVLFQKSAFEFISSNKNWAIEIPKHIQFDRFSISFMNFCWTGTSYKRLNVSVDIVPAVQASNVGVALNRPLYRNLSKSSVHLPIYIVLRTVKHDENFLMSTMCFRMSTTSLETAVFKALDPNIRKAYILTKALLIYSPFSTQFHRYNDSTLPYVLQDRLSFYIQLETEDTRNTADDAGRADNHTRTEVSASGGHIPGAEMKDAATYDATTRSGGRPGDIYKTSADDNNTTIDFNEYRNPHEPRKCTSNSRGNRDLRDVLTQLQDMQDEGNSSEGDIQKIIWNEAMFSENSAETFKNSTVTSYMLKNALFHLIEEETNKNQSEEVFQSSADVIVTRTRVLQWAKRICKMFLKCIEKKRLSSYFLDNVNLLTDDFEQSVYDLEAYKASMNRLLLLIEICENNSEKVCN